MSKKEFNKIIKTLEKAVKNVADNIEMAIGNLCKIYDNYFIAIKKLDR